VYLAVIAAREVTAVTQSRSVLGQGFELALEAAPCAMLVVDHGGRIVWANRLCEQLFGYAREDLTGQFVELLVPAEQRESHPAYREKYLESPQTRLMGVGRDLSGRRRDGSAVPVEIGLNPVDLSVGEFVVASIVDITERKQAEQQQNRYVRLLDSGFDAVFVRDAKDRIINWNRGAEQLYGWSREEALGQVPYALLQTRFPKSLSEILADVRSSGSWEGELLHTRKDGVQVSVSSRWTAETDEDGRPVTILETNMDISERKRAQQALQRPMPSSPCWPNASGWPSSEARSPFSIWTESCGTRGSRIKPTMRPLRPSWDTPMRSSCPGSTRSLSLS